jgi:hypothetical protein
MRGGIPRCGRSGYRVVRIEATGNPNRTSKGIARDNVTGADGAPVNVHSLFHSAGG